MGGGREGAGERGRERGRGGEKGRYLSASTVSRWSESRERERERERNRDIRDWMRLGTASLTISILQNIGMFKYTHTLHLSLQEVYSDP